MKVCHSRFFFDLGWFLYHHVDSKLELKNDGKNRAKKLYFCDPCGGILDVSIDQIQIENLSLLVCL